MLGLSVIILFNLIYNVNSNLAESSANCSATPVAPNHPRASQDPPMFFYPQQQALFSPPTDESFGGGSPMVQAMDVIGEEDFKVVVGRDGTTLDGIRMCSQVGATSSDHHFFT